MAFSITGRAPEKPELTSELHRLLLQIAHSSIAASLAGQRLSDPAPSSPSVLSEPRGVFTTLYLNRELRGCVGYPLPIHPLYLAVAETARSAAFDDPRFQPVTGQEAARLKISLSILSPLFPIASADVEIGRHGLLISDAHHRGLLLPQVPVEHQWDRETFLAQTCLKAGLPPDAWRRDSITLQAFSAEVFGDEDGGDEGAIH